MILFYLLISAMPLTRHPLWEKFVSDFTVIKYIGSACLLYAIAHGMVARERAPLGESWQMRCTALLVAWAVISYGIQGPPIGWALSPLMSYFSFLILLFVTLKIVDTPRRLRHVLWAFIASLSLASLYVIREWQKYHALYAYFRPGWVTGDPNYYTASVLLGIPLALVLARELDSRWQRLAMFGAAIVLLLGTALAASRGGLLGLLAGVIFLARRRRRLLRWALVAALLLPPALFWRSSPLERLLHPTVSDRKAADTRLALWQAGLDMIRRHPLAGIGLGNFKYEVQQYAPGNANLDHIAHNAYIEIAAEMGLPALFVYLWILFAGWQSLGRAARMEELPGWMSASARGLQAGLLSFSVSQFFLSAQYTKMLWLVIALSACMPMLCRVALAEAAAAAEAAEASAPEAAAAAAAPAGAALADFDPEMDAPLPAPPVRAWENLA